MVKKHHHTQHWSFGNLTSSLLRNKYRFGLPFPPFPQGDDDEVLCLPLHELQCKAEVQIYDRGITTTILHKGWISVLRWCAGMCNLTPDGNSTTWHCFFNSGTCAYTPCVSPTRSPREADQCKVVAQAVSPLLVMLVFYIRAAMLCLTKYTDDLLEQTQETQALQPDLKMKKKKKKKSS